MHAISDEHAEWPERSYTDDEIKEMIRPHRIPFHVWKRDSRLCKHCEECDLDFVVAEEHYALDLESTVEIRWAVEEAKRLERLLDERSNTLGQRLWRAEGSRKAWATAFFVQFAFWLVIILWPR